MDNSRWQDGEASLPPVACNMNFPPRMGRRNKRMAMFPALPAGAQMFYFWHRWRRHACHRLMSSNPPGLWATLEINRPCFHFKFLCVFSQPLHVSSNKTSPVLESHLTIGYYVQKTSAPHVLLIRISFGLRISIFGFSSHRTILKLVLFFGNATFVHKGSLV